MGKTIFLLLLAVSSIARALVALDSAGSFKNTVAFETQATPVYELNSSKYHFSLDLAVKAICLSVQEDRRAECHVSVKTRIESSRFAYCVFLFQKWQQCEEQSGFYDTQCQRHQRKYDNCSDFIYNLYNTCLEPKDSTPDSVLNCVKNNLQRKMGVEGPESHLNLARKVSPVVSVHLATPSVTATHHVTSSTLSIQTLVTSIPFFTQSGLGFTTTTVISTNQMFSVQPISQNTSSTYNVSALPTLQSRTRSFRFPNTTMTASISLPSNQRSVSFLPTLTRGQSTSSTVESGSWSTTQTGLRSADTSLSAQPTFVSGVPTGPGPVSISATETAARSRGSTTTSASSLASRKSKNSSSSQSRTTNYPSGKSAVSSLQGGTIPTAQPGSNSSSGRKHRPSLTTRSPVSKTESSRAEHSSTSAATTGSVEVGATFTSAGRVCSVITSLVPIS